MKKAINYRLTEAEKQDLKASKVSQKMLQDLAPDEIAALLNASPGRAKELQALAEFQSIPSLGINFAEELISQGYFSLEQLKGRPAAELFDAYERHCGAWADPCVEDSYRLLVHYIENRDDTKRWWNFTAERKAYREQNGFPADRPGTPWYQTEKYLK
ncbi:Pathogenicity locus [Mucilaginibacter terrigena]|uniref:Pathogenicity locus n=1 Tax=Mucilaginibacter terrigena TaxID=2492395 RepID=A0A4Q5LPQ2_9SPHI|nr:helix-hairpin-helix domain-containing protein [Mucilaginibacter terrigena]RYU91408.1 Pathogenicity locus [Mucilaginibacter terrigena]